MTASGVSTRPIWLSNRIAFLREAEALAPLKVCIFNVGANVNFPLLDTTERVFRKVWEMACNAGFLVGRKAARLMRPEAVAEAYWQLYQQPRDAWTFELEIRPFGEKW